MRKNKVGFLIGMAATAGAVVYCLNKLNKELVADELGTPEDMDETEDEDEDMHFDDAEPLGDEEPSEDGEEPADVSFKEAVDLITKVAVSKAKEIVRKAYDAEGSLVQWAYSEDEASGWHRGQPGFRDFSKPYDGPDLGLDDEKPEWHRGVAGFKKFDMPFAGAAMNKDFDSEEDKILDDSAEADADEESMDINEDIPVEDTDSLEDDTKTEEE